MCSWLVSTLLFWGVVETIFFKTVVVLKKKTQGIHHELWWMRCYYHCNG